MKIRFLLLFVFLASCMAPEKIYTLEIQTVKGRLITREYILPDSINIFITVRRDIPFLVYKSTREIDLIPTMIYKNAASFRLLENKTNNLKLLENEKR
jgi:hypothetical protein